ncbi:HDOD domain-containing protein [Ideonella livida]|uniref:HDOD domain-containing protein n=1 Tax=Ideonella livida TaxID=2707176 RepID=A0A7C9TKK6_9BURK|nr:HDOD domain-containing protein [Ideonella livida]NDY91385.1 HDOD domain-containing protein [Ideonella livida]
MPMSDKFFANAAALPSMPEVASRLLKSFEREDMGMQELADLIGRDQGLSAKLLRLANSARYSPRHTISSLKDAASTIGLNSLRDLALAACVAGAFPKLQNFDRMRFWRKCLATAGHARVLAQASDLDPDAAYLAGLVMRTGELLMLMHEPEAVARAEELAHLPDSLLDHEMAVLQCNHLEVTAELARRWKFPDELVRALAAAVDPMACRPFCPLGGVLRLASVLADAGDMGLDPLATLHEYQPDLFHHMHFDLNEEWLASHLASYETLTAGVDQLLH